MNCFEWQNHASDYLDGTLIGPLKREADEHLDACPLCNERQKHYRVILSSISSQPRSRLPIPIRRSPFSASIQFRDAMRRRSLRARWESVPWYVRTGIEGLSIVSVVILGVTSAPKLRKIYERGVESRLNAFNESLSSLDTTSLDADQSDSQLPLARGTAADTDAANDQQALNDFDSEGDSSSAGAQDADSSDDAHDAPVDDGDIHVGNAEIWRFNLKTDSPFELRSKVITILSALHLPANTPGLGGIEAPGGIQFDLMLPKSAVPYLKRELEKIAPPRIRPANGAKNDPSVDESFTWYKNKSKHPIPAGKAHVVIWLSQV